MKYTCDIILPVFLEQDNIKKTIQGIEKYVKSNHRIIVVCAVDSDPTIPIVKNLISKNKKIVLIKSKYGKGLAKQLKTGIEYAKADVIVIMMSDLSDNPADINKMIKKIHDGYDLVSASRYTKDGKRMGGPILKGFLSRFACLSLMYMTGIPTTDVTNAFKCFRKDIFNSITIESIAGFELALELTVKAYKKGYKITEVPTIWKERQTGKSKFNLLKDIPYYVRWYLFALMP